MEGARKISKLDSNEIFEKSRIAESKAESRIEGEEVDVETTLIKKAC